MIFVQTNDARENELVAFTSELQPAWRRATGGRGTGTPHLPSQGSVVTDGKHVLVANAGSSDVSLFSLDGELLARVPAGGERPVSIAVRGDRVYVLNAATASIHGFTLSLEPRARSLYALPDGADPAQIAYAPDGESLIVTDRAGNSIVAIALDGEGLPVRSEVFPSSGRTPYGFAFAGDVLVVTEAFGGEVGAAAASSYRVNGTIAPVSASVPNTRSEVCWAVASADGRHVWVTNFGDGTISRYDVAADGTLALVDAVAATTVDGAKGVRDAARSRDGRMFYALDADAQQVFAYRIDGGTLTPAGNAGGLPATVAGLAAL
jgi:6-phosphogluconolactonase (cycloisomerase 2 family)